MSGIKITWIPCIMHMRMERHICSPETFQLVCTLKLRVMSKFGINEYYEMLLIYGECGRKAKAAARLYRERFPEGPHPTRHTILKVAKTFKGDGLCDQPTSSS
ncbi:hypothetical protein AVEN_13980-1 [Araneus ventricosus]|uniref:DUF4817 domain-containing protein n=1 Tax=Araneus ventricosus TaxID=182803 RepID=A0A4Y2UHK0_ARAVE|nr:hypothetical protein AVEN_13980-1 [Araneus ventricosus]